MSDEDRDVDIECDAERRAYHNELERKRRDHIKESFSSLRDSVPQLHGEKVSRAQILKKAADYITHMRRKTHNHQQDIEDLKRHNNILEQQIKSLEKNKCIGQFSVTSSVNARREGLFDVSESDSAERTHEQIATKKLKLTVV